jgi:hypothetical protein
MEREHHSNPLDLIELGSVSGETKGDSAPHWEAVGLRPNTGLSDD